MVLSPIDRRIRTGLDEDSMGDSSCGRSAELDDVRELHSVLEAVARRSWSIGLGGLQTARLHGSEDRFRGKQRMGSDRPSLAAFVYNMSIDLICIIYEYVAGGRGRRRLEYTSLRCVCFVSLSLSLSCFSRGPSGARRVADPSHSRG